MEGSGEREAGARRRARTLGWATFAFMACVSVLIFLTESPFDAVAVTLMIGMPPVMGAGAYFVGLRHRE